MCIVLKNRSDTSSVLYKQALEYHITLQVHFPLLKTKHSQLRTIFQLFSRLSLLLNPSDAL